MLVRSAHSANIKERRDCSTALFDAAGEMVMQAEHIPVHLGAMPAAVAAVLDEDHAAGRLVGPQRPLRAAARTCPTSRSSRPPSHDGELLGFAASRAHHADVGGRVAGLDAGRLDARSTRRASSSRRACSTTPRSTSSPRRCASPPSAAPTCAPSSPPTAPARGGWASSPSASAPTCLREATAAVLDYAERRTRACLAALDDGDARRRVDVLEAARRRPRAARWRATVDGDELTLDFAGTRRPARRQPQLPAGRHARAPACSPCACSPTPTSRPARAPTGRSTVDRARGLAAQRALARRGRRRQRRDLLARRRPRARARSAARSARGR